MRRSDSRISALKAVCTVPRKIAAQATRKSASGVIGEWRRGGRARGAARRARSALRASRPCGAAAPRAAPSGRRRARDRSRAGAEVHAARAPESRWPGRGRRRAACRPRDAARDHDVAEHARLVRRETTARRWPCPLPRNRRLSSLDPRDRSPRATVTWPARARRRHAGATIARQRARPPPCRRPRPPPGGAGVSHATRRRPCGRRRP